ncbi:MAG: HAD-IIIA family hydrolase [Desulfovibrionaceae bacterium]|nr:HAD-IIIA family hydrolase [Desulfovibrionaceae bacterium]
MNVARWRQATDDHNGQRETGRMIQAVFVVGGRGTRLGLTDRPKPMVDFCGKPLLERMVEELASQGVTQFLFLTQYMSEYVKNWFGDGSRHHARIDYVEEASPLGTAGSVLHAKDHVQEECIVIYGDVFFQMDVKRFVETSRGNGGCGTLFVHPNDHPHDSDLVHIDQDNRIDRFYPKPHEPGLLVRNKVNAAIYYLKKEILQYIETRDGVQDFGHDVFPAAVQRGARLYAYNSSEYVKDIGTKDRLARTIFHWKQNIPALKSYKNAQRAVFLDRDGVINEEIDGVYHPDDLVLLPGVGEAVAKLNASTFLAICITNQPGVAKGFVSFDELDTVHARMDMLLAQSRAYLDDLYFCPHHPEAGWEGEVAEFKIPCACRKPGNELFLRAAKNHHIDLKRSFMVGDRLSDLEAGKSVGCFTILIRNEHNKDIFAKDVIDAEISSLHEAVAFILQQENEQVYV